jgi:hypothetical protein
VWSWVPLGSEPRITLLARTRNNLRICDRRYNLNRITNPMAESPP